jgi:perosamine synthetase
MKRLRDFIKRRYEIAARYNDALAPFILDLPNLDANSSWHLYIIRLSDDANISRLELFNKLRESGIGVNVHYIPIYKHPYYKKLGFEEGCCPVAEKFYETALSVPIFPKMTDKEQSYVIEKLQEFSY